MTEKGTIVILSNTHWHFAWQTGNSVAAGFASRGYRVLFVEPIPKRWPRLSEAKRVVGRLTDNAHQAGVAEQALPDGVHIISPVMMPDVGSVGHSVNRSLFVPRLVAEIRRQLATSGPVVLIHTLPVKSAIAVQQQLQPDFSIYRCVHDWARDPFSSRKLFEADLLREVDLAWADCDHNLQRLRQVRPDARLMLPAVELELFTETEYVASGGDKPLCVCFGSIGLALDIDLLKAISHRYPLRLVGPVKVPTDGFSAETEMIGPVPHEEVPLQIRDADVLLLPYNTKPHVQGLIPAKFFECLSTGKPIVATNLTTVDRFKDLIYLCDDHEAVFAAIEAVGEEDVSLSAERVACAQANSWTRRIDEMEQLIQTGLAAKPVEVAAQ